VQYGILGPLEVRADGRVLDIGGAKPGALLATLLVNAGEVVSTDRLAMALWGSDAPAGATKAVRVYVSRLRRALGRPDAIITAGDGYRLALAPGELDADVFAGRVAAAREALAAGRAQEAADAAREGLELWRGAPLPEIASAAPAEISRLEEERLAAVELRIDADLAAGRAHELVGELQRLTAEEPLRERLHAQLMLALYRTGRQAEALEAFRRARTLLVDELGVEPGSELRRLHEAMLAQDPALERAREDATARLPVPASALFGRDTDIQWLTRECLGDARLVTLVGPGGVGKTRLAIEAARRLAAGLRDGARFLALAAVTEPEALAGEIARQLEAPERREEPVMDALRRHLGDRRLLLVLDNFEQVVAGAPVVGELLAACPGVTVLATSREPLRVTGERVYPLEPLPVGPAVEVFCDRARARDPRFALDADGERHVQEICRRLDGLPLALELAAARLGLLSPAQLAARLDSALTVLGAGARDAPERHRTLRETIGWSHQLLAEDERRAFARLAVFAGGATVEAAEAVTGASLEVLDSLVAKQLLVRRDGRLQMLATVRAYALERLGEDPEAEAVYDRLAAWCLEFLALAAPEVERADAIAWTTRLDTEQPNVVAALPHVSATRALELAVAIAPYWWHARRLDGYGRLEAALAAAPDAPAALRARALLYLARLAGPRNDAERYRELLGQSLELHEEAGEDGGIAECLGQLAVLENWLGDAAAAAALVERTLACARRTGDPAAVSTALMWCVQATPGYEPSAELAHEAVAALRASGNEHKLAWVASDAGYKAIAAARYDDALGWLGPVRDMALRVNDPVIIFSVCTNLGLARLFRGELDEAAAALREALAVCRRAATENVIDETLLGAAAVAAERGDDAFAARLAGAAGAHEVWRNLDEDEIWRRLVTESITPARERMGAARWDAEAAEGAALAVHDAIDEALRDVA
jgi:predicted ATPase/DNA-binding SARP family transcriptional activator